MEEQIGERLPQKQIVGHQVRTEPEEKVGISPVRNSSREISENKRHCRGSDQPLDLGSEWRATAVAFVLTYFPARIAHCRGSDQPLDLGSEWRAEGDGIFTITDHV